MAEYHSTVHTHHIFFTHSSAGHWGCSHGMAIVNSAAVNNGEHVSFCTCFWSAKSRGRLQRNKIMILREQEESAPYTWPLSCLSRLRRSLCLSEESEHLAFIIKAKRPWAAREWKQHLTREVAVIGPLRNVLFLLPKVCKKRLYPFILHC